MDKLLNGDVTFWHFLALFVHFCHPVVKMPKMDKRCQKLNGHKTFHGPTNFTSQAHFLYHPGAQLL